MNSEMSQFINLNDTNDDVTLSEIFNNEIIVFEDVQGSKIWVNYSDNKFQIKPRSISNEPINMVDLAMQNFYNKAVDYFSSLDIRVKGLLYKNWWFCFEYFSDEQPANISYQRLPKNGLVLTTIYKNGKYESKIDELKEYARLFNVDYLPVIFEGKLSNTMIEAIKYFLNTSENDLEYVFGEKSFTFFFYKILNPSSENSFLMIDTFQDNIEKLIIRVKNKDISFEILNPLYKRISDENITSFSEIYTLILLNFLNFCQSVNIDDLKIKGKTRDEAYIYLICKIFNMYITEVKEDILNFDFVVPEFFSKEKFKINKDLILNKLTKDYITEDPKLEYIYKVILGSFNKHKKNPIGVFTENTIILFNNYVDKINQTIDQYLNKMREIELGQQGLIDFGDYLEISYNTDAEGNVYPDVYKEIGSGESDEKKKKGGVVTGKEKGGLEPEKETKV